MSKTFRAWTIDQPLLLPPSVQDFGRDKSGEELPDWVEMEDQSGERRRRLLGGTRKAE